MKTNHHLEETRVTTIDAAHALPLVDERPLKVNVVSGAAYLTREGDQNDYILKQGESLCIRESGKVVIQGFPYSQFKVAHNCRKAS
ncbi:MAG: DUF2917 domain-containing protein [Fimbriimonadaceae bacterium]|nr:DUF2917 domain-containing protein [Fimbriimonadaceae bacterium]